MSRPSQREIDKNNEEHIRHMGEPEPYRTLRLQKERIEHEQAERLRNQNFDFKAEELRDEIRKMGHKPEA